jgi:hypothetical protein
MDNTTTTSLMTRLARGDRLCLTHGQGSTLHVEFGCIWLTQHNDQTDYVMVGGGSVVLNGQGKTLIHAYADTVVCVTAEGDAALPDWSTDGFDRVSAAAA